MAFIRVYQESDKDAMIHIFRDTAAPDLRDAGDPVLHYASFLWCRPYLMLEPETCFVLDDGNGVAVGYLLGVPDTASFVQKYEETYIPHMQSQGLEKPGPDEPTSWNENLPNALREIMFNPRTMLHEQYPQLMEQWPAHIHIDILTPFQKQGWGRRLIEQFCGAAKERSVKGLHLLMAAANEDAGRFYPRVGFSRFPYVIDNGVSGEEGRDSGTIWFVKSL
ncbi:hypothetical protein AYO21_11089 [Fonsecaea monophora]|uniref:N-acetyltransferase domain-containing protein n=1 Tax=Fonsecaea monophora TaxID=254056 RepID=A0A177ETJ0_9EURO|nr:hypothetical protein AYO21_11089 [Fonsecaea monophora]KAH0845776.1 hypothetical protein FOPE_12424 [Fonsecaea pedrosoi]OAG34741.1 hypothetical protein AYO21_11089 [Fonsecaea monophora]